MLRLQFISAFDTPFSPSAAAGDAYVVLSAVVTEQRNGRRIEPIFRVTVRNPGVVGWMPSALRYADLWEQRDTDPAPVHIARGRLVPLPTGMAGATIELTFRCLPPSSDDILTAAADALRIGENVVYDPAAAPAVRLDAEYYDPVCFGSGASDDPDNVLTARPEVWRWDRKTLALGRTHLVDSAVVHEVGYQGVGEPPSLSVTHPPKPLSKLRVVASWTQSAKGRQTVSALQTVQTYTADDFQASFPQPGASIGASTGWTVGEAKIESVTNDTPREYTISGTKFGSASGGRVKLQPKTVSFRLTAAYDYTQQRQEILDIAMPSGLQALPDEDDESEVLETVTLAALNIDSSTKEWLYEDPDTLVRKHYNVGDEVLAAGKAWTCATAHDATENFRFKDFTTGTVLWNQREKRAPMADARNPRYLDLNRGVRTVRHCVLRLYRAVLERSQCAETSFEVPWLLGRGITCADSCRIAHPRLPGGELVGKVIGVELLIDEGGRRTARITLASVPGTGAAAPTPSAGQQQAGGIVYSPSYPAAQVPVNAFGLAGQAPRVWSFENPWSVQHAAAVASSDPVGTIGTLPTRLRVAYTPLREEDLLTRRMSISCVAPSLPKQLNLRPDLGV